ncbi:ATP phosphoribosyltransferase [Lederbergia galactosidilytica]|uniref:ATP phosphoribosyltransferase n=1 Tax=Lederbergia galactosidilytica TaxID=217031 RepID=A0A177ZQD6_9BACI|nr:ATP phosphoribosyltransferase [Lederbergia galactosidilytica]KRG13095.1 ATP phosphoribosyltransferase [Virgibacillus soli]MBP1916166.1 ATP phosphoribosyltransferase [Lederbergia galactosidilytica]OAK70196.1 ATP phosphoribosyltransferase [Lederbergia galactosidilytica]
MTKPVVALTKGRVEKQFIQFLEERGFDVAPLLDKGRKLQVETEQFFAFFAKGIDVATYVEHGIADLGIVGEDILLEVQPDVFDLLPLPFGQCRFAVAGEPDSNKALGKQKIATKYPNITTDYFRKQGKSVDIVKLEGSVELAPLLGLADDIVDIVETGNTLKENGLVVKEEMFSISARCIANRNSLKLKKAILYPFIEAFRVEEVIK